MKSVRLNISPCPNDTFMFDALINKRIDTSPYEFEVNYYDIEELNSRVLGEKGEAPEISKISYAVLPAIAGRYKILRSGSALGKGNGPLLVSARMIDPQEASLRIAVPGINTTANLLMERLFPRLQNKTPVLFSRIADAVLDGAFDAGVLIHEGRFTYSGKGLRFIADLGVEWEARTRLPLPLGAIVARNDMHPSVISDIDRLIKRSIVYAMENPGEGIDFIVSHAREMETDVINAHIHLFVNNYSIDLGREGKKAVRALTGLENIDIFV